MDHWDQESSTLSEIKTHSSTVNPAMYESNTLLGSLVHTTVPAALSTALLARLKSEIEVVQDPSFKALLLHELGTLEEFITHDELGAARDYLTAFNTDSNFQEPLEALIRILERRRSLKNLSRVIDSLIKAADSPEQRARALRARANNEIFVHQNRVRAREFLEQAIDVDPEDATSWLMLEIDAALRAEHEERVRAFTRRIELSQDTRWAGLLRIDLAEMRATDGDVEDALDVLTEVISSPCTEAWRACEVAERLAHSHQFKSREAWALMQRGEIVLESLSEPIRPRGEGVSLSLRSVGVAVDAFMRAAIVYRSIERVEDEAHALERASFADANAITPRLARIRTINRLGHYERGEKLARELIAYNVRAEFGPTLWLSIAETALLQKDRPKLLEICNQLIENSVLRSKRTHSQPQVLVAHAFQRDLLLEESEPIQLAEKLEQDAHFLQTAHSKAAGYLQASLVWSLLGHNVAHARAANEQAHKLGFDSANQAYLNRVLASIKHDDDDTKASTEWYRDSTLQLKESIANEAQKQELTLDLLRLDLQQSSSQSALEILRTVEKDPTYGVLARLLSIALRNHSVDDNTLHELSDLQNAESQIALNAARVAYAIRDQNDSAHKNALLALSTHAEHNVTAALVKVLQVQAEQPIVAAQTLETSLSAVVDPYFRDTLRIASSLLYAQGKELEKAIQELNYLETEASTTLKATQVLWARYAARGSNTQHETILHNVYKDGLNVTGWAALECLIYALYNPNSTFEPGVLLAQLGTSKQSSLVYASLLLQAFWPDTRVPVQDQETARNALIALSPDVARWVHRSQVNRFSTLGNADLTYKAAQAWFKADGGIAAALEMLLNATTPHREIEAQVAIASKLTVNDRYKILSGAALLAHAANVPAPIYKPTYKEDLNVHTQQTIALTSLEWSAPGSNPVRRAQTLHQVADIAPEEATTLLEMAGWSALACKDYEYAKSLFEQAIEHGKAIGNSVRFALEGLVETEFTAAQGSPTTTWATAVEQLAEHMEHIGDTSAAATLWEQVGHAWWNFLEDAARGEQALNKAFFLDHKKKTAFERVFRAVRTRKEDDKLLLIVGIRLKATNDPIEMAKLFWEQARVLRAKGERDEALNALENVTLLEPDHVGALALSAEIYVSRQMFAEAALALERLAQQSVPPQQKLGAGLGAADLYETKLNQYDKALEILIALDHAGLGDLPLHERIVRTATLNQSWNLVRDYLTWLVKERPDSQSRVSAARNLASVCRVRLNDEPNASNALIALLSEAPTDIDALEELLELKVNTSQKQVTLEHSLEVLRTQLQTTPTDIRIARIVSKIALELKQDDLAYRTFGALRTLNGFDPRTQTQSQELHARLGLVPAVAIHTTSMQQLIDPEDSDAVFNLLRIIAPALVEAFGPTLDALNVGRRERIDVRSANALRNEIAAWAGAFGMHEWELYISDKHPNVIQGVPLEMPALVVGSSIQSPLSLEHRVRIVRELFGMVRGTTIVQSRDEVSVAAILVAACEIADVHIPAPAYSVLAETQKLLNKAVSRKIKKALPPAAQAFEQRVRSTQNLRSVHAAALRTLDRVAAIAVGDPNMILKESLSTADFTNLSVEDLRVQSLLRFIWSNDCFIIRQQLGLAIG